MELAKTNKSFKRIYIEITNHCNLACSFCPTSIRKKSFMSLEKFQIILNRIKPYTDFVYLHVKGEPLFHPEIIRFIEMCGEYDLKVNLTTNGTLIHKYTEKLIKLPALRQISFSLQSFEGAKNEEALKKYLNDILNFIDLNDKNLQKYIELRMWNIGTEGQNLLNDEKLDIIKKTFGISGNDLIHNSRNKGIKLKERVFLSQSEAFEWPDIDKAIVSKTGFCYGGSQQLAVLVDGTVVPCCLDQEGIIKLGNIFEQELEDILQSDRYENLLKSFQSRILKEPLCQRCGFRQRFDAT